MAHYPMTLDDQIGQARTQPADGGLAAGRRGTGGAQSGPGGPVGRALASGSA
jgi:hypothetical protein